MKNTLGEVQDGELAYAMSAADAAAVREIRVGIRDASRALRSRHPWLDGYQDELGLTFFCLALSLMIGTSVLYARGVLPGWGSVLLIAFACSIAHEIEHDLIHRLYFARSAWLRHVMMGIGWLMRPSTVNPWIRIRLHLDHHRISGTADDLEERSTANGEPWGLKRLLMTGDGFLSTVLRLPFRRPGLAWRLFYKGTLAYGPLTWLYHGALAGYLFLHLRSLFAPLTPNMETLLPAADFLAVVWIFPNLLRTFCLHFVSSNLHYFGDVRAGDILRQTQVLNPWFFLPLQLFCCNFGGTHAIHHFWVSEPFYIRQWTASEAHMIMRAYGVRFNDLSTFRRANRYRRNQKAPVRPSRTRGAVGREVSRMLPRHSTRAHARRGRQAAYGPARSPFRHASPLSQ